MTSNRGWMRVYELAEFALLFLLLCAAVLATAAPASEQTVMARPWIIAPMFTAAVVLTSIGLRRLGHTDRRTHAHVLAFLLCEMALSMSFPLGRQLLMTEDSTAVVAVMFLLVGVVAISLWPSGRAQAVSEYDRRNATIGSSSLLQCMWIVSLMFTGIPASIGGGMDRFANADPSLQTVDDVIEWANTTPLSDAPQTHWDAFAALPLILTPDELEKVDRDRLIQAIGEMDSPLRDDARLAAFRHGVVTFEQTIAWLPFDWYEPRRQRVVVDGLEMRTWIQHVQTTGDFRDEIVEAVRATLEAAWPVSETSHSVHDALVLLELADQAEFTDYAVQHLSDVPRILDTAWAGQAVREDRRGFGTRMERQGYVPRGETRPKTSLSVRTATSLDAAVLIARLQRHDPQLVASLDVDLPAFHRYLDLHRTRQARSFVSEASAIEASLASLALRRAIPQPEPARVGFLGRYPLPIGAVIAVLAALGLVGLAPQEQLPQEPPCSP